MPISLHHMRAGDGSRWAVCQDGEWAQLGGTLADLLAGSLDRAVDVAATLELRGYGLEGGRLRPVRRRSRHDTRFRLVGAGLLLLTLAAALAGVGGFDAYPTVAVDTDPATLAFAALVALAGLAPLE